MIRIARRKALGKRYAPELLRTISLLPDLVRTVDRIHMTS